MVNHTQTIRRQQPTNCLNVLDHFVGLTLRGLTQHLGKQTWQKSNILKFSTLLQNHNCGTLELVYKYYIRWFIQTSVLSR